MTTSNTEATKERDKEMSKAIYRCVKCGSSRLIYIRLDSDWGYSGDVSRVNEDKLYEKNDHENGDDRPDIEIYHCEECGHQDSDLRVVEE